MNIKQVIVMRKDLNMRKGKMIAQGAHACLAIILDMLRGGINHKDYKPNLYTENGKEFYDLTLKIEKGSPLDIWINTNFRKIALSCDSNEELIQLYEKAIDMALPVSLITDDGLTEFGGVQTDTCIAIGPALDTEIDKITKTLKLL